MSYAVYSTRGFILGSAPTGEASKIYLIYTEDFGLVRARAQSVRLLTSKLRYNLEDYSFGTFSLVRGREIWRLTGTEKIDLPQKQKFSLVRARVLNLVKRLVQGEEKNEKLFKTLLSVTEREMSEPLILAHILDALGYLNVEMLSGMNEKQMIQAVNKALKETHL
ncbi:MAG: recombination protein O N-terminal domain-containing protein [bacterium]|nr:recombination protein O N-terminal domain-containing protein [bacterium]